MSNHVAWLNHKSKFDSTADATRPVALCVLFEDDTYSPAEYKKYLSPLHARVTRRGESFKDEALRYIVQRAGEHSSLIFADNIDQSCHTLTLRQFHISSSVVSSTP